MSSPSTLMVGVATFSCQTCSGGGTIGKLPTGGISTRRGRNLAAVAEYAFRSTDHSNVFIAVASVGCQYLKPCQIKKLKRKLKRKAQIRASGNFAQSGRSLATIQGRETSLCENA